MRKLHFDVSSIVNGDGDFEEQYWNDEFKSLMALFDRFDVTETVKDNMGHELHLARFKDGGYCYFESTDCEIPEKEKLTPIIYHEKQYYIAKTCDLNVYISKDFEEVIEELKEKTFVNEKIIKRVGRNEDVIAYLLVS